MCLKHLDTTLLDFTFLHSSPCITIAPSWPLQTSEPYYVFGGPRRTESAQNSLGWRKQFAGVDQQFCFKINFIQINDAFYVFSLCSEISSLAGVEHLTSLCTLSLPGNNIREITGNMEHLLHLRVGADSYSKMALLGLGFNEYSHFMIVFLRSVVTWSGGQLGGELVERLQRPSPPPSLACSHQPLDKGSSLWRQSRLHPVKLWHVRSLSFQGILGRLVSLLVVIVWMLRFLLFLILILVSTRFMSPQILTLKIPLSDRVAAPVIHRRSCCGGFGSCARWVNLHKEENVGRVPFESY